MIILPGSLIHQAIIQRFTLVSVNDFGEEQIDWIDVGTVRCSIKQINQNNNTLDQTVGTHTIGLRYLKLELNDRLILKDDIYSVLEIENIGLRDRQMILTVQKVNTRVEFVSEVQNG